jgi:DNA-binding transcriptional regulator YiaG
MNKEDRIEQDVQRILSKPDESANDSTPRTSSANPLLTPDTLESFGVNDQAGEAIIENVLNRQEILQIFAPSGIGKSIYVDNIVASLLSGETLFGEFKVVKPVDVYLAEFEMSSYERGTRLRSIIQNVKAELHIANFMSLGYKLSNPTHFAHFAEAMAHFKPAVFIIDPWKAAHNKDENNNSEMDPLIGDIRKLMSDINASCIVVHHSGRDFIKPNGTHADRHGRGGTVLDDRSDVILEIEETDNENETILRRRKLRGMHKVMAKEYRIQYDSYTGVLVSVSKRGQYADFIRSKRLRLNLTQEQLAERLGINVRTLKRWEAGLYNQSEDVIARLREM